MIGVIGAGVMGTGVAQTVARAGYDVVLVDNDPSSLERARQGLVNGLKLDRLFSRGTSPATAILEKIRFTTDLAEAANAGFIIENITEDPKLKRPVYETLDSICEADCVFAADTSAIPITMIASWTRRADRVIGIHFMNPVPAKPTVEVIPGVHTSETCLGQTLGFLERIGKQAVVVKDSPGFVSNRVLMLTINEAIFLLHEHVADANDVDRVFTECFGHPMGPLATADLIGLDTILRSIEVLYEAFADSKFRPCPLLRQMVDAGYLGRKSGRGFFSYDLGSVPAARRQSAS